MASAGWPSTGATETPIRLSAWENSLGMIQTFTAAAAKAATWSATPSPMPAKSAASRSRERERAEEKRKREDLDPHERRSDDQPDRPVRHLP